MNKNKQPDKQVKTVAKTPRERSSSYPAVSLQEAVDLIGKVKKAVASAPFNRDTGVKAMGYAGITGSSAPKIAALVHFGLLQRTGDVYRVSALAERILIQKSEDDKKTAIVEAAKMPKLYNDLISKFKDQSIPTLLSNILIHDHGISEKVSRQAANDFTASVEYAGILVNGVIADRQVGIHDDQQENTGLAIPPFDKQSPFSKPPLKQTSDGYSVPLPSGIVITFPQEMGYIVSLGKFAAAIKQVEEIANKTNKNREEKDGGDIQAAEGK